MDILKPDRSKAAPPDRPEYFSGPVRLHNLRRPEHPGAAELIGVFFDRGARTIPHIHEADQVLYFVEGEGIVATERERPVLRTGEFPVIPGGSWHRHRARSWARPGLPVSRRGPGRFGGTSNPQGMTTTTSGSAVMICSHAMTNDGSRDVPRRSRPPAISTISGTQWPAA